MKIHTFDTPKETARAKTTQIYARITNSKIGSDMQGLDKKFVGIPNF